MSTLAYAGRTLHGGCHCGRCSYVIDIPGDAKETPELTFHTERVHVLTMATPLAAFLRVPLDWFHTRLFPRHDDETEHMIRRRYMHGSDAQRVFCGFCGTPVSYWNPVGHRNSDYINVTLGSLRQQDIHDLDSLGLVPTMNGNEVGDVKARHATPEEAPPGEGVGSSAAVRDTTATGVVETTPSPASGSTKQLLRVFSEIPWFDTLVDGSALGKLTRKDGARSGTMSVQWEIFEWPAGGSSSEGGGAGAGVGTGTGTENVDRGTSSGKRDFGEFEQV